MVDNIKLSSPQTICDIVIPIHNSAHWVDWCVDEVIRYDSTLVNRVILVDDQSKPEQSELIKRIATRSGKIFLFHTPGKEHGFGIACNYGASQSSTPYLLFLNTDCLITKNCIESLLAPFLYDPVVVLACPVSNNSPILTFPMFPGHSYVEMDRLCKKSVTTSPIGNVFLDACTVVGNCLMVRKDFFEKSNGFDRVWGKGYGEETDLQMKAFSQGLWGVVVLSSCVYHHGSGTLQYDAEHEQIKKRNYALFMSRWSREYRLLEKKCAKNPPMIQLERNIRRINEKGNSLLELDILFFLPALNQSTGGFHVVVSLCNALIREGVRACCAVVGEMRLVGSDAFQEPVLFEFLYFPTIQHFLADKKTAPRIVVSTLFSSASPVSQYAQIRGIQHIQFVQGYEAYFDVGRRFSDFINSLTFGEAIITTSSWLEKMLCRHLPLEKPLIRLPLGVNEFIFYPSGRKFLSTSSQPVVGAVLRSAPDKGQGMVLEVLDRLISSGKFHAIIFRTRGYSLPAWWSLEAYTLVELPQDQLSIACRLREVDIFLDASLHEGFGLMPLEALACGCTVVCSDSGGINDFVKDGLNGFIVRDISDPEIYIKKIKACLQLSQPQIDEIFLGRRWLDQYVRKFKEFLATSAPFDFETWQQNFVQIPDIPLPVRFYGTLLKIYMKVQKRIPFRIHLALKALFGQSH